MSIYYASVTLLDIPLWSFLPTYHPCVIGEDQTLKCRQVNKLSPDQLPSKWQDWDLISVVHDFTTNIDSFSWFSYSLTKDAGLMI